MPLAAALNGVKGEVLVLSKRRGWASPLDESLFQSGIDRATLDAMLAAGFLEEVRALRARGDLSADLPSMRCVGYRQAWEALEGLVPMAQWRERGIFATRQLAKRQLTWLRGMPERRVVAADASDVVQQVVALARQSSVPSADCGPANALMDGWGEQHTGQPLAVRLACLGRGFHDAREIGGFAHQRQFFGAQQVQMLRPRLEPFLRLGLAQRRADPGMRILNVIHRIFIGLALGQIQVEIEVLIGLAQGVEETAGIVAHFLAQFTQGHEFARAGGHRGFLAIAIEHGVHNEISYNEFSKDKEAIRLWSRKQQPADWGYAKFRDTRSADYIITKNRFDQHPVGLNLTGTDSVRIAENTWVGPQIMKLDATVTHIDSGVVELIDSAMSLPVIKDAMNPFKGNERYAGRKNILITEWGPYDFRSPIIWNTNPADTSALMQFDILGPAGNWKIRKYYGVEGLSAVSGTVPGIITARKQSGLRTDIGIELEYIGGAVTDPFGKKIPAGRPYRFQFRRFFQPIDWQVKWYSYDSLTNPVHNPGMLENLSGQGPVKEEKVNKLDYAWWGGVRAGEKQYPQFITLANGQVTVPEGNYELSVTWDDAVRLYLDGKIILDEWEPSKYSFDESPNRKVKVHLSGNHNFRVEHAELNGFATLAVKLRKLD